MSAIPRPGARGPAFDRQRLYAEGLDHIRALSGRRWSDHNLHDPGITILELATFALTDLASRAALPIADLFAPDDGVTAAFHTAAEVLPMRALTARDYRKLLVDLEGVRNAWVEPVTQEGYFCVPARLELSHDASPLPGTRRVALRGLHLARLEPEDPAADPAALIAAARKVLHDNRNLCEDFVEPVVARPEYFALCAEIDLEPGADPVGTEAAIRRAVDDHFAPPVLNWSLEEMLARRHADGRPFTVAEIFDGPLLAHGFIADEDLDAAPLRTEIHLSDVMALVMKVPGVLAVRDLTMSRLQGAVDGGTAQPMDDRWRVSVTPGRQPRLSAKGGNIAFFKRNLRLEADAAKVALRVRALAAEAQKWRDLAKGAQDLPIPAGTRPDVAGYLSFQNHFPELYGLSQAGLGRDATDERRTLALQLKGFLLFFDQLMANFLAQLAAAPGLLSRKAAVTRTYYAQQVLSFRDAAQVYGPGVDAATLAKAVEPEGAGRARRNRFLDHLVARLGEDFHHYLPELQAVAAAPLDEIALKCAFLEQAPALGAQRSRAFDHTLAAYWDSDNVSGLERRIARLLGIDDASRRDLATDPPREGLYVIEHILLRPRRGEPFLQACFDTGCADCADDDPYSYRLHVVLPAEAGRFRNMDFRRFAEQTIRAEVPAHILPRVCWVAAADLAAIGKAYRRWLGMLAGEPVADRAAVLGALIDALDAARSVYPEERLRPCDPAGAQAPFILGRTALGTLDNTPP